MNFKCYLKFISILPFALGQKKCNIVESIMILRDGDLPCLADFTFFNVNLLCRSAFVCVFSPLLNGYFYKQ